MRYSIVLPLVLIVLGGGLLLTQNYWVSKAPDIPPWKKYENSTYKYTIQYPADWSSNGLSAKFVAFEKNSYTTVSAEVRDYETQLGVAVVCSSPTTYQGAIASGHAITFVEQTACALPEERDTYGEAGSVEANVPLRDGMFLYVRGDYTARPQNTAQLVKSIITTLQLTK